MTPILWHLEKAHTEIENYLNKKLVLFSNTELFEYISNMHSKLFEILLFEIFSIRKTFIRNYFEYSKFLKNLKIVIFSKNARR